MRIHNRMERHQFLRFADFGTTFFFSARINHHQRMLVHVISRWWPLVSPKRSHPFILSFGLQTIASISPFDWRMENGIDQKKQENIIIFDKSTHSPIAFCLFSFLRFYLFVWFDARDELSFVECMFFRGSWFKLKGRMQSFYYEEKARHLSTMSTLLTHLFTLAFYIRHSPSKVNSCIRTSSTISIFIIISVHLRIECIACL